MISGPGALAPGPLLCGATHCGAVTAQGHLWTVFLLSWRDAKTMAIRPSPPEGLEPVHETGAPIL